MGTAETLSTDYRMVVGEGRSIFIILQEPCLQVYCFDGTVVSVKEIIWYSRTL